MAVLGIVFPDQDGRGTHVNISGAGVTRYAPNRAAAIRFMEYLTSEFAQRLFAEGNNEYPVVGKATGPIAALGDFKEDQVNAAIFGKWLALNSRTVTSSGNGSKPVDRALKRSERMRSPSRYAHVSCDLSHSYK